MKRIVLAVGLLLLLGGSVGILIRCGVLGTGASPHSCDAALAGSRGNSSRNGLEREVNRVRSEISRNPRNPALREELAILLSADAKYEEAISELRVAIQLRPSQPSYHYSLAQVYRDSGRAREALHEALLAAQLGQKAGCHIMSAPLYSLLAAELLKACGDHGEAEGEYELALAQLSALAPEWRARNINKDGLADNLRQQALNGLHITRCRLMADRPSREWVHRQLPYMDFPPPPPANGNIEVSDLERRVHAGLYGGESAHIELGSWYFKRGEVDKAVIEYLAATQLSPRSSIGWFNLGIAYLFDGRLQSSASAFEKASWLGDTGAATLAQDARKLANNLARRHNVTDARR